MAKQGASDAQMQAKLLGVVARRNPKLYQWLVKRAEEEGKSPYEVLVEKLEEALIFESIQWDRFTVADFYNFMKLYAIIRQQVLQELAMALDLFYGSWINVYEDMIRRAHARLVATMPMGSGDAKSEVVNRMLEMMYALMLAMGRQWGLPREVEEVIKRRLGIHDDKRDGSGSGGGSGGPGGGGGGAGDGGDVEVELVEPGRKDVPALEKLKGESRRDTSNGRLEGEATESGGAK